MCVRARELPYVCVCVCVCVVSVCCVCNTIDVFEIHTNVRSMTYSQHSHLITYAQTIANVASSPRLDLAGTLAAVPSTQAPDSGTSVTGEIGFVYQVALVRHCLLFSRNYLLLQPKRGRIW